MPTIVQVLLALALLILALGAACALYRTSKLPKDEHEASGSRERTRALSGLVAVFVADAAIATVAVWSAFKLGITSAEAIGILTGAFTAVSTMTTAYLGIKAVANTAQEIALAPPRPPK